MSKVGVIFIHGAFSTGLSFKHIIESKVGKTSEWIAPRYDFVQETYEEIFQRLKNSAVELLKKYTHLRRLVIVGHSMGGVLGLELGEWVKKYWMQPLEVSVVTLAAPFGGVHVPSVWNFVPKWLHRHSPGAHFYHNLRVAGPQGMMAANGMGSAYQRDLPRKLTVPLVALVTVGGNSPLIPEDNDSAVTVESQYWYSADPLARVVEVDVNHFEILFTDEAIDVIMFEVARRLGNVLPLSLVAK